MISEALATLPALSPADVAQDYMVRRFGMSGQSYRPHTVSHSASKTQLFMLALSYESATHAAHKLAVAEAYSALCSELAAQFRAMLGNGLRVTLWHGGGEPYPDSFAMRSDIRRGSLRVLATNWQDMPGDHPLVMFAPFHDSAGQGMRWNDVFRAVHDYFGHAQGGFGFAPVGEFNAWLCHSAMFSRMAWHALSSETIGQTAWVNFGPHMVRPDGSFPTIHDADYVPLRKRPFARQKACLLPLWLLDSIRADATANKGGLRHE